MTDDYERFWTLLQKRAPEPALISEMRSRVRSLIAEMNEGWRGKNLPATLDPQERDVANAISLAVGRPTTKVVLGSLHNDWISDDAYRGSVWILFDSILRESGLWRDLEDDLGYDWGIEHLRRGGCWNTLWSVLDSELGNELRGRSGNDGVRSVLFALLGFAVAGNRENIDRLDPLVVLLPAIIPFGEKEDEPGTWLVLVR